MALAAATVAPLSAQANATRSPDEPRMLSSARAIRSVVDARYRIVPGRKLAITEVTATDVLESFALVTHVLDVPRVVPADNGVYFAICPVRAHCPYPARSAAWPTAAFLPRREALELALRTFLETSASLVVVALPTARPTMLVLERADVVDAAKLLDALRGSPSVADADLRRQVDRFTWPSLFVPIGIVDGTGTGHTLVAVGLEQQ